MNIFKKFFAKQQTESSFATINLNDPLVMAQVGVNQRKDRLNKSLHTLAELKVKAIQSKNMVEVLCHQAADFEEKAIQFIKSAEEGLMDSKDADRLAFEALRAKEEILEKASKVLNDQLFYEKSIIRCQHQVSNLRLGIRQWTDRLYEIQEQRIPETETNLLFDLKVN